MGRLTILQQYKTNVFTKIEESGIMTMMVTLVMMMIVMMTLVTNLLKNNVYFISNIYKIY